MREFYFKMLKWDFFGSELKPISTGFGIASSPNPVMWDLITDFSTKGPPSTPLVNKKFSPSNK